jgi:hypothetical protein
MPLCNKERQHPMYKYDGKKVAGAVWALCILYGFMTLPNEESNLIGDLKGWVHVLLYAAASGVIILIILFIIREEVNEGKEHHENL